jgi:hypothetical protein
MNEENASNRWRSIPKKWNHHNCCREAHLPDSILLKVIDCSTRTIVLAAPGCEYVALSYVWGLIRRLERGDGASLPPSCDFIIEDAIRVTLELGFRFLWVDRYCVNQNDTKEAIEHQIKHMHLIYQAAVLTLIASAGENASYGLPGVTGPQGGVRLMDNSSSNSLEAYLRCTKWMSRGWTYQEALFSDRRLYFMDNHAMLSCRKLNFNDQGHYDQTSASARSPLRRIPKGEIPFGTSFGSSSLMTAIEQYSKRNLTFDSDIIRACRGVLEAFRNAGVFSHTGVAELQAEVDAGVQSHSVVAHLSHGLCWTVGEFDEPMYFCERRDGFPSCSWTS